MNPTRSFETHGLLGPVTFPTRNEIDWHLRRSRQLRADATAALLSAAARAAARPLAPLARPLTDWHRRRRTQELLMRCSDRVLDDIGIERETIPLIARGLDPLAAGPRRPAAARWWQDRRLRWQASRQARRAWRHAYRELNAYRDHELDELGIRRVDIPSIVRGRAPASAFG